MLQWLDVLTTMSESMHMYFKGTIKVGDEDREIDAYQLLGKVHNSTVGHVGMQETRERLIRRGLHWPGMNADVSAFVKACPGCQKASEKHFHTQVNPFSIFSTSPMEQVAVDTLGPLPRDEQGNLYVIVVIDTFTRYIELYKAHDTSAKSAAKIISADMDVRSVS